MVVVVDGLAASGGYIAAIGVRPHRRAAHLAGRLDRRDVPVPERQRAAEDDRRQGRGDQVVAAEGRAQRLRADQPGGARGDRVDRDGLATPGSRAWCRTAASIDDAALDKVADGRVFTGRQAIELKLIDALGDEQTAIAWLAKEKKIDPKTPVRDYRLQPRFSDLSFLHVARRRVSTRSGLDRARRSGSRTSGGCRRSSGSTLTVFWRFGTLRRAIDADGPFSA